MKKNRKIILLILGIIAIGVIKIMWDIRTINNASVVSVDDIDEISVSTDDSLSPETIISGEISTGRNESVFDVNKIMIEDTLYIIMFKKTTLLTQDEFSFDLDNVSDINGIQKIVVVSGDIYSGEGSSKGFSYSILPELSENLIVWEASSEE